MASKKDNTVFEKDSSKTEQKKNNAVEVMYQKLGNDWYVFTTFNNQCYYTKVNMQ